MGSEVRAVALSRAEKCTFQCATWTTWRSRIVTIPTLLLLLVRNIRISFFSQIVYFSSFYRKWNSNWTKTKKTANLMQVPATITVNNGNAQRNVGFDKHILTMDIPQKLTGRERFFWVSNSFFFFVKCSIIFSCQSWRHFVRSQRVLRGVWRVDEQTRHDGDAAVHANEAVLFGGGQQRRRRQVLVQDAPDRCRPLQTNEAAPVEHRGRLACRD